MILSACSTGAPLPLTSPHQLRRRSAPHATTPRRRPDSPRRHHPPVRPQALAPPGGPGPRSRRRAPSPLPVLTAAARRAVVPARAIELPYGRPSSQPARWRSVFDMACPSEALMGASCHEPPGTTFRRRATAPCSLVIPCWEDHCARTLLLR